MRKYLYIFMAIMALGILLYYCDVEDQLNVNSLPENIVVDIPNAISAAPAVTKSALFKGDEEIVRGDSLYELLRVFIFFGEHSAMIVEDIITSLMTYNIDRAMEFSFISDEDGREKFCKVIEEVDYEGKTYDLQMTVKDSNNIAFQIIWMKNAARGVAILQPYYINMTDTAEVLKETKYMIEFSDKETDGYEKHMIVSLTGFPMEGVFAINNLKMFVGKKGDIVEVYGNSNHPNFILLDQTKEPGRSWSFVAKGNRPLDIGVASVGIPPSTHEIVDDIFTTYSLYHYLKDEVTAFWETFIPPDLVHFIDLDSIVDSYLAEARAPAYFSEKGWIACGDSVPDLEGFTADFIDLSGLSPFIPNDVNNLVINYNNEE